MTAVGGEPSESDDGSCVYEVTELEMLEDEEKLGNDAPELGSPKCISECEPDDDPVSSEPCWSSEEVVSVE
jgi:hypothetical protein